MSPKRRAASALVESIGICAPAKKQKKQSSLARFVSSPSKSPPYSKNPTKLSSTTKAINDRVSSLGQHVIYCDLDGVLCDFDAGVKKLFNGLGPNQVPSKGAMWGAIHKKQGFHETLPWTHDGKELWNSILKHHHTYPNILTGVPMSRKSRAEKALWCAKELGTKTNHVDMAAPKFGHDVVTGERKDGEVVNVLTCWSRNKHFESRHGAVLIDDRESLSVKWEEAGGIFIHHTSAATTLEKLKSHGILTNLASDKEAKE